MLLNSILHRKGQVIFRRSLVFHRVPGVLERTYTVIPAIARVLLANTRIKKVVQYLETHKILGVWIGHGALCKRWNEVPLCDFIHLEQQKSFYMRKQKSKEYFSILTHLQCVVSRIRIFL